MFFAVNSENEYLKHSHTLIGLNLNASTIPPLSQISQFKHMTRCRCYKVILISITANSVDGKSPSSVQIIPEASQDASISS